MPNPPPPTIHTHTHTHTHTNTPKNAFIMNNKVLLYLYWKTKQNKTTHLPLRTGHDKQYSMWTTVWERERESRMRQALPTLQSAGWFWATLYSRSGSVSLWPGPWRNPATQTVAHGSTRYWTIRQKKTGCQQNILSNLTNKYALAKVLDEQQSQTVYWLLL